MRPISLVQTAFSTLTFATLSFLFATVLMSANTEDFMLESLNDLRWKNRIILVSHPTSCETEITRLRKADAEVLDRDILWFALCPNELTTNFTGTIGESFSADLIKTYFGEDRTGAVLIGKDGGIKNQAKSLNLIALNQQIDTMPMRQEEMREKANQ